MGTSGVWGWTNHPGRGNDRVERRVRSLVERLDFHKGRLGSVRVVSGGVRVETRTEQRTPRSVSVRKISLEVIPHQPGTGCFLRGVGSLQEGPGPNTSVQGRTTVIGGKGATRHVSGRVKNGSRKELTFHFSRTEWGRSWYNGGYSFPKTN